MSTTVTTQAELDAALASKATIYIDSPVGVWLTLTYSGSSSVVARGSSRVEARDSSSVVARDSSRVVAWDSSRVVARDSSSVVARDSSSVVAWDSSRVVAGKFTAVHLHSARATIKGGVLIDLTKLDLNDASVWLDYHGVKVTRAGYATVYKAVLDDWTTGRGAEWTYSPGATVTAVDFKPTRSCGAGLHFGVSPAHSAGYLTDATRFVAVKVKAADLIPLDDKCKAPSCVVLHEVDRFGDRVSA